MSDHQGRNPAYLRFPGEDVLLLNELADLLARMDPVPANLVDRCLRQDTGNRQVRR